MPTNKPPKPYPEFPLFAHANGQWARKKDGKLIYYGPWADWRKALAKYNREQAGVPATMAEAVKKFLDSRRLLCAAGEIGNRHLNDTDRTLASLSVQVGEDKPLCAVMPEDFAAWRAHVSKTNGHVSLAGHIRRVRAFLNWCKDKGFIASIPKEELKKPALKLIRQARAAKGSRMFKSAEIRKMLSVAGPQMRCWILLALNCGLGNNDLALLTTGNLQGKWLDYPRPKTGVERRIPLWKETREALAKVIRPGDEVVFRTKQGNRWTNKGAGLSGSPISQRFCKFCRDLGIYKEGRGFYSLRHVAQTLLEESGDPICAGYILGHAPSSGDMASVYRERMSTERLLKAVRYVRRWIGGIPVPWAEKPLRPVPFVSLDISHLQTGVTTL